MLLVPRRGPSWAAVIGGAATLAALLIASPLEVHAQSEITRSVIGSGGVVSGVDNTIRSTFGQTVAGSATGTTNAIYVGFWSAGAPGATGVPEAMLPAVYRLYQNVPNPFNPRTSISFDLPKPGSVRLRVYDIAGRLVRTLVDGEQPAGSRSVVWPGTDDRGRSVASGIYIYVLETDQLRDRKKMTLVR